MSDDEQQDLQWAEAVRWLRKARYDLVGARTLLGAELRELAAFHIQQAVEKALKALLVAAAQDIRRSHDIESLAHSARAHWPDIIGQPFALTAVNQWYLSTRYPGIDELPPSAVELTEALGAVSALIDKIRSHVPARLAPNLDI